MMKKMNRKSIWAVALALILTLSCLTGCSQSGPLNTVGMAGGILRLRVNPEIEVAYDADGNVTHVEGRNDDGSRILESYTGYEGKTARQVVSELVSAIGEAGYFVEEVDGKSRQITIEIESGSQMPSETFLDDVVTEVRSCVSTHHWHSPVEVEGESDYGMSDYVDTDYGPENDGDTDYNDTDYDIDEGFTLDGEGESDYNDSDDKDDNDGKTDYKDTDYGPGSDGKTDYDDKDDNGKTDYKDTDYGPGSDGKTDYDDKDENGKTDYKDTDYGPGSDGKTDYDDKDETGKTDYDKPTNGAGKTDYDRPEHTEDKDDGTDYDSDNDQGDGGSGYDL